MVSKYPYYTYRRFYYEKGSDRYECLNKAVSALRCAAPIGAAWKKDIEEDYKRRKK